MKFLPPEKSRNFPPRKTRNFLPTEKHAMKNLIDYLPFEISQENAPTTPLPSNLRNYISQSGKRSNYPLPRIYETTSTTPPPSKLHRLPPPPRNLSGKRSNYPPPLESTKLHRLPPPLETPPRYAFPPPPTAWGLDKTLIVVQGMTAKLRPCLRIRTCPWMKLCHVENPLQGKGILCISLLS